MKSRISLIVLALMAASGSTAWAHPHAANMPGAGGLAAGFFHPLLGLDHLLAMFAVGMLGAQMGGRAIWALPAAFLGLMIGGGVLGMAGYGFQWNEIGIAISVVALGLALAVGVKYPLLAATMVVGLFGLLHGHAHGTELPALAAPLLYGAGFVFATAALHLAGIGAGLLLVRGQTYPAAIRVSGAAISLAGLLILFQAI